MLSLCHIDSKTGNQHKNMGIVKTTEKETNTKRLLAAVRHVSSPNDDESSLSPSTLPSFPVTCIEEDHLRRANSTPKKRL